MARTKTIRARRATTSTRRAKVVHAASSSNFISNLNFDRSYVGLLYGIITVFILSAIIFLGLRLNNRQVGRITNESAKTSNEQAIKQAQQIPTGTQSKIGGTYTVEAGDNLWKIAEKQYKSGYNWVDIAKANNLTNPGVLLAGAKLTIPNVTPKSITVADNVNTDNTTVGSKIEGTSYTVVKGDTLWSIAVRAYNDGYKWPTIAKVNNLANPGTIHSGNTLIIPR